MPQLFFRLFQCLETQELQECGFEIGGSYVVYVPKTRKPRLDSPDCCVRIVEGNEIEIFSIKVS